MRSKLVILVVVAIICLPHVNGEATNPAEESEFFLQWNVDFGDVYVSSQAIASEQAVFVRTSSSSLAQGIPTVYSLNFAGEELWRVQNPNSTFQDMTKLEFVKSGAGHCGSWPDMLLVGWSDGLFQALRADNGAIVWQHQTEADSWGITGNMLVEDESVTMPTRKGVDKLCLDGSIEFTYATGFGWRNGVTFAGDSYWIGDEEGNLWSVTNQGATKHFIALGKIRHAPVQLPNDNLIIHLQTDSGSTVYHFNTTSTLSSMVVNSGYSPALPTTIGDYVITADSQYLRSISCEVECVVKDSESFRSNGEISNVFGTIMLPQNTADGGYGQYEISIDGELISLGIINYADDWYGTAGVESWSISDVKYKLLVNDNANLKMYATIDSSNLAELQESDWPTILVILSALILISITSIQLLQERFQSAFKFFILFMTILLMFTFGDIIEAWTDLVTEDAPASDAWNDEWPESWLGTQIVVFEFKQETVAIGGLLSNDNVLEASLEAANQQGLDIDVIESNLGKYVVSIGGITGEGWEYTVNGQPGTVSAEFSELESDSIVVWKQL
ncbi:MAG: DUF4430 domain-containing protein [Candidatus Poseidoniaceae archaeon]